MVIKPRTLQMFQRTDRTHLIQQVRPAPFIRSPPPRFTFFPPTLNSSRTEAHA